MARPRSGSDHDDTGPWRGPPGSVRLSSRSGTDVPLSYVVSTSHSRINQTKEPQMTSQPEYADFYVIRREKKDNEIIQVEVLPCKNGYSGKPERFEKKDVIRKIKEEKKIFATAEVDQEKPRLLPGNEIHVFKTTHIRTDHDKIEADNLENLPDIPSVNISDLIHEYLFDVEKYVGLPCPPREKWKK